MKTLSPNIIFLPWRNDATEYWFSVLSSHPWAMLLHSGYARHHYSRFDIIVADPIGTIVTYGDITNISLYNSEYSSKEDPFTLLDKTLHDCGFNAVNHPDLPFQCGAVGLFGYDLIRRFEILPKHALNDISLPDMAIGLYDWALITDYYKRKVILLSCSNINSRLEWLKAQKKITGLHFRLTTKWNSNMSIAEYAIKFNRIQHYLRSGDCYQVNLAQRFQACYQGDEWQAFIYLNIKNRAPFSAFLRFEEGVILSFSPERFIQLSNRNIQTRPIKGTLPRLNLPEADNQQMLKLMSSIKDRTENLMIVDLMRNDIGRVADPGTIQVPELFVVEQFPTVHHLVSTIIARLSPSYNSCDLLRAVFPGGSITGVPKVRAMEIIDELEPHRRNCWCGSIGYLSACGNMDTNINIRALIAFNGTLYCYAGGGIIIDSQLQTEYQETFDKVNRILPCLDEKNNL